MKYISIDIETTGIDNQKNQLIQFAAVIDNTVMPKPISELPKFSCYVAHPNYNISSSLASKEETFRTLAVIEKISKFQHSKEINTPAYNGNAFRNSEGELFVAHYNLGKVFYMWLEEQGYPKNEYKKFVINSAGKNVAGFDIPFIKNTISDWSSSFSFPARVFDPSILYFDPLNDTELPSLSQCKEKAGIESYVSHDALDDAIDVINLLRVYWSKKWN